MVEGVIWKIAKRRDTRNKHKFVEWKDIIPKTSIILFDFELTSTGRLRKATTEHLQKLYSEN